MTEHMSDDISLAAVRELLELITQTDISELYYERGGARLTIKREPARQPHSVTQHAPNIAPTSVVIPERGSEGHTAEADHLLPGQSAITAPIVGTFYASPSPKEMCIRDSNNTVTQCWLGVTPAGAGSGNENYGVYIQNSSNNQITNNVISANLLAAVYVTGDVYKRQLYY